jgi:predicted permease
MASVSTLSPMSGRRRGVLLNVSGAPPVAERDRGISINQVSAGYFETLGVKLSAGRLFTEADQANFPKVAILNETAAKARFPDANPLGRRVTFPGQRVTAEYEVVGIVRDTRYADLRKPAEPMVYLPLEQAIDPLSGVTVAIRARGDATGLAAMVRRRAQETVPGGFLTDIATVQQQVDETLVEERMISMLASLFGGLALLLAAIGLYGIVSFSVIRRTREIGIRISIGAQQSSVLWLILRSTLQFVGIGVALGIPLVLLTKRYIDSELFGIEGGDPVAIAATILLLACVALGAGTWPAWRASCLDPIASLRQE